MINTYNESTLHHLLKMQYAEKYNGQTEQLIHTYICDVVAGNNIYEIQTANVSSLKEKIAALIGEYCINVIFPIAEHTVIETRAPDGTVLSCRKSPKKGNIHCLFREITGLVPFLGNPNLVIHVLLIDQKDIRERTAEPVQLLNKSRRWRKNWIRQDKELVSVNTEIILNTKESYRALVAKEVNAPFTAHDLENTNIKKYNRLVIWVLKKVDIIEEIEKKGRYKQYRFKVQQETPQA